MIKTLHLSDSEQDILTAAAILKDGGLVAMPTETVYGLAADALNGQAVRRIFEAKGRPADNPLIVHIADIEDIERLSLVEEFTDMARRLAEAFWPGPLTMILGKGDVIPDEVSSGLSTVAVRMPSHPVARSLIRHSGLALAAPSANTSGKPSPTTAAHVIDDMDGRIEAIIDGGSSSVGVESTVITLVTQRPRILRPGIITREEIEAVIGDIEVDSAVLERLDDEEKASSPGMKYKHYAPKARVILVRGADDKYVSFINRSYRQDRSVAALCYEDDIDKINAPAVSLGAKDDLRKQASRLFDALREVDRIDGVGTVYAHCPEARGVGMALYNRLIRAAAFTVIDLPDKRIIGLSGQTGAGKSVVADIMRRLGAEVISADMAAREVVEEPEVKAALCAAFGDVLLPDRSLDRPKIATIAFCSREHLQRLNDITHPRIVARMLDKAAHAESDTVVFDAPQLFEAGADRYCDCIISILSAKDKRIERLISRDNIDKDSIELRMSAQHSEEFFIAHSDCVIRNDGTLSELTQEVERVYRRLRYE